MFTKFTKKSVLKKNRAEQCKCLSAQRKKVFANFIYILHYCQLLFLYKVLPHARALKLMFLEIAKSLTDKTDYAQHSQQRKGANTQTHSQQQKNVCTDAQKK